LVDTYDTLKCGVKNAIRAYQECGIDNDYQYGFGIRLDSGDLAYLSRKCRDMLDKAGYTNCKIFATNALDEYLITDVERQDAKIDAYGVGDAIATSKHNPCFGNVFKLVQIEDTPVIKRSEDKIKLINPGFQVTYRIIQNGKFKADITCLRGDATCKKIESCAELPIQSEFDETQSKVFPAGSYGWKVLQEQVIKDGEILYKDSPIPLKREYYLSNLASLNETEKRLINPHYYKVDISDELYDLKMGLINNIIKEIKEFNEK
jgi:nicotinate phosphoribosyltransferase